MTVYSVWNNKGGTGKTSLTFQTVCRLAERNRDKKILVIDMCPQANMSEILLGGQEMNGSTNLLTLQAQTPRGSVGGYFDMRLGAPFSPPDFQPSNYICQPSHFNEEIPNNIDLIAGDPLLELQAIAMNSLANNDIPGINAWIAVIDWLRDLLDKVDYDLVFIDTNPSFSMYTQIALAASDRVILPVMADDSSRRAIQNAFSLIYGLRLPSEVYSNYTFAKKMNDEKRELPKIHGVLKNRLTQYMGKASAFAAVLSGIDYDLHQLIKDYPEYFTFSSASEGVVDVRDFGTTGVIAFARGCPFSTMPTGKLALGGRRVQVKNEYRDNALDAIDAVVTSIERA